MMRDHRAADDGVANAAAATEERHAADDCGTNRIQQGVATTDVERHAAVEGGERDATDGGKGRRERECSDPHPADVDTCPARRFGVTTNRVEVSAEPRLCEKQRHGNEHHQDERHHPRHAEDGLSPLVELTVLVEEVDGEDADDCERAIRTRTNARGSADSF